MSAEEEDKKKGDDKDEKKFDITALFTRDEIIKAVLVISDGGAPDKVQKRLTKEIVRPALKRIDKTTGDKNNPEWLAYLLEWGARYGNGDFSNQRVSVKSLTNDGLKH